MIALAIPSLPPSSNHAYVNNGFGGRMLSKQGKAYKLETTSHLIRTYPSELRFFEKNVPYFVYARFYFNDIENKGYPAKTKNRYKHLDASNRTKLFEDALKDAAGIDDSQHMLVLVEKRQGDPERTEVFAWRLDNERTPIDDLIGLRLEHLQSHRAVPVLPKSGDTGPPVRIPRNPGKATRRIR